MKKIINAIKMRNYLKNHLKLTNEEIKELYNELAILEKEYKEGYYEKWYYVNLIEDTWRKYGGT